MITLTLREDVYELKGLEKIVIVKDGANAFKEEFDILETLDVKDIWSKLKQAEQDKFENGENGFLSWLGNDAGYNYDGL